MCELSKNGLWRIDPCIKEFIGNLKLALKDELKIVACCCGHRKYPMTIVVKQGDNLVWELVSGKYISRKKRFYRKDGLGYYYIPEVSKPRVLPSSSRRIMR